MRILVIQLRRFGDILMTTPLVRALDAARPAAEVHFCVAADHRAAIDANPHVDVVVSTGQVSIVSLVRTLRLAWYDVVIDCHGTPATARLAFLSGAKTRIGFDRRWRRGLYTHRVPPADRPLYSALEKLSLLGPLGIRESDCRIDLEATAEHRAEADSFWRVMAAPGGGPIVAWAPVSRRDYKTWPADRYAAVCDAEFERSGARFLPLFGPDEASGVERAIDAARHRDAFLYPRPALSFGALKPVIERCALYFGNDGGIRHVAIAAGVPTLAVFGPADPACWTPPSAPQHRVVGGRRPITDVSVADVSAMLADAHG